MIPAMPHMMFGKLVACALLLKPQRKGSFHITFGFEAATACLGGLSGYLGFYRGMLPLFLRITK
jgi:hypothetical protein